MNLGLILGPLWSGAMIDDHLAWLLGVNLALVALVALLFLLSFDKMKGRTDETPKEEAEAETD